MLFLKFSSTEYMIGISNIKIAFFSFVEKLYVNNVSALMYKQNNPLLLKQTASEFIRIFSIQSDTNSSVSKHRISPVVEKITCILIFGDWNNNSCSLRIVLNFSNRYDAVYYAYCMFIFVYF